MKWWLYSPFAYTSLWQERPSGVNLGVESAQMIITISLEISLHSRLLCVYKECMDKIQGCSVFEKLRAGFQLEFKTWSSCHPLHRGGWDQGAVSWLTISSSSCNDSGAAASSSKNALIPPSFGRKCHRKKIPNKLSYMTDTDGLMESAWVTPVRSQDDDLSLKPHRGILLHVNSLFLQQKKRYNPFAYRGKISRNRHQVVECPKMKTYENPQPEVTLYLLTRYFPHNVISGESFFNVIPVCLTLRHNLKVPKLDKQNHPQKCRAEPMVPTNIYRSVSTGSQAQFQLQPLDSQSKRSRFFVPRRSNSIFNIRA